jgi:hypothetical protein
MVVTDGVGAVRSDCMHIEYAYYYTDKRGRKESVHFLGVHLSWEYYIVFIYVVLYQLECSICIFEC